MQSSVNISKSCSISPWPKVRGWAKFAYQSHSNLPSAETATHWRWPMASGLVRKVMWLRKNVCLNQGKEAKQLLMEPSNNFMSFEPRINTHAQWHSKRSGAGCAVYSADLFLVPLAFKLRTACTLQRPPQLRQRWAGKHRAARCSLAPSLDRSVA